MIGKERKSLLLVRLILSKTDDISTNAMSSSLQLLSVRSFKLFSVSEMICPSINLCSRCLKKTNITDIIRVKPSLSTVFRRNLQTQQFQPFGPPPPNTLPKAAPPKQYRRSRKWARRFVYLAIGASALYGIDNQFYSSCLSRTARALGLGAYVALDYKINFRAHPPFAESITALHARSAERLYHVLRVNGGLYLKMGQAIAMQSAVLPPEFQKMFANMFDDAPQNSWEAVEQVIREDFGKSPEELFGLSFTGDPQKGVMERRARASASVAQVHWARLQDGREVAIKVQKREIARQVGWDLWTFK